MTLVEVQLTHYRRYAAGCTHELPGHGLKRCGRWSIAHMTPPEYLSDCGEAYACQIHLEPMRRLGFTVVVDG